MLNNFTGQGYWTTLALLSAGYYFVIYLLYYRKYFRLEFSRHKPAQASGSPLTIHIGHQPFSPDRDEEFTTPIASNEQADACMDELAAYFEQSKRTKCVKRELLFALQRILSKHSSLRGSEFQEAITNIIVSEGKHHCSIQLNNEEMRWVWLARMQANPGTSVWVW